MDYVGTQIKIYSTTLIPWNIMLEYTIIILKLELLVSTYYKPALVMNKKNWENIFFSGNRRIAFDFKKNNVEGLPDGMTIDTDGNLWIACFDGSQVIKVDPVKGELLQQVPIPALQVTSVAFGGKNLDELYVTSASMNIKYEQKPPCGAVFKVTGLGVKGFAGDSCILWFQNLK